MVVPDRWMPCMKYHSVIVSMAGRRRAPGQTLEGTFLV
jgi:hypothetical protein